MNTLIFRQVLLIFGATALLVSFNQAIYKKETVLHQGAIAKLKLAPRDPRSLMTGDYMVLNYEISNHLNRSSDPDKKITQDGFVIVHLNDKGVAEFVSQSKKLPTLKPSQLALQYRLRNGHIKFATNAFFFQEGHGKAYEAARYGEFRVSPQGELLLTHLLNEQLLRINP